MHCSLISAGIDGESVAAVPSLRVEVLTEAASLEALQSDWSALVARSASNEPMLSPTWLLPWWQSYGHGRQLRVGVFYQRDRLVGLAPLQRRRYWYRPGIPFWRLEYLGADVDEEDGVASDYLNVIAEVGFEEMVADKLARALVAGSFGKWTEVVLPAMDRENHMVPLLGQALVRVGLNLECPVTKLAPYIPLPKTWQEYVQCLPQRKRYVIVRALRDFEHWAGQAWELHEVHNAVDLAEGCRILQHLHNERWQAGGQQGAFEGGRFRAFHNAVMPRLLAEGRLQLLWLAVRSEPIAALYNITDNHKVYFYQSGRKMDVPKGQRPGIVILAKAIQRAIAAGCREFDFLAGPCQYKSQFAPAVRSLVQIRAVPMCLKERIRRWARYGAQCTRSLAGRCRLALGHLSGDGKASPADKS